MRSIKKYETHVTRRVLPSLRTNLAMEFDILTVQNTAACTFL